MFEEKKADLCSEWCFFSAIKIQLFHDPFFKDFSCHPKNIKTLLKAQIKKNQTEIFSLDCLHDL